MTNQPLVSFLLLTYNQCNLVDDALQAALAQTYRPLEIIVSDDASTDGTGNRIREILRDYTGPHRVVFNRNDANLGISEHCNKLMAMARGDIFVLAAGDDISLPKRVASVVKAFVDYPSSRACVVKSISINRQGVRLEVPPAIPWRVLPKSKLEVAQSLPCFHGAAMSYHRDVYDAFGPIHPDCWGEDVVLSYRARLLGDIVEIGDPLIEYRTTGGISTTSNTNLAKSIQTRFRRLAWLSQLCEDVNIALNAGVISGQEAKDIKNFFASKREVSLAQYQLAAGKTFRKRFAALKKLFELNPASKWKQLNWMELLPHCVRQPLIFLRGTLRNQWRVYRNR